MGRETKGRGRQTVTLPIKYPKQSFLAARRPGNTQYGPAELKVSWTGPAEMKVNWAGPAETKASWTRPTLGGARKALILWGAGEE